MNYGSNPIESHPQCQNYQILHSCPCMTHTYADGNTMHVFLGFYKRQRHPLYWTGKHLNRIISEQLEHHSLAPYRSMEQKQRVLQVRWSAFHPTALLLQFLSVLLLLPPYNQVKLKQERS